MAWALQVAILLGAAFPAFLDLYVVHRDGINVVYLDQWLVVPLFQKLYAGTLTLGDLFAQHNEHRILFPRILMLALGAVTRYDTVSEMYCSWLLLVASAFIFYLACRRTLGASRTTTLAILPLSFVAFSLRQQEALLFGFEVQWTLGLTSVLAAIYFLDSAAESKAAFLGAAFAGIVSSYSFASGLLIWPLGLFQLFVAHRGRDQRIRPSLRATLGVWIAISIGVVGSYFNGYHQPPGTPPVTYLLSHPVTAAWYYLAALGGALFPTLPMATTAGAILVVLYATVLTTTLRRASKSSYINTSIPTALITLTLAEAAMLAVGRSGFGAQEAIMSRYSMLAIPGVIGLYLAVTARCIEGLRKRPWQLALGFVLGIIVLGAPLSDWNGLIEAAASRAQRAELAYDLTAYQVQSNSTLSQLYPDYALVRREAPVLEQYRLNVFSTAPTDLDRLPYSRSNVGFAVDLVGGHLLVSTPKPVQLGAGDHAIRVTGWAFDQPHGRAAGAVFVRLDTDPPFPCLYGLARPDIAAFFRNSRYRNAGFMCSFSESILSPGRHILTVEILSHDRQRYVVGQPSIAVVAQ